MGELVVHCVGEGGWFVLVDRHRWVVREVRLVQHREHRVSWFLSSLTVFYSIVSDQIEDKVVTANGKKGSSDPPNIFQLDPGKPCNISLKTSSFFEYVGRVGEYMMKCKTVSKPERISLWPAISFIHFFLLNWKKRFSTKFIFNQKPVRRSCVRLNARRSRDRLRNCSMISCQTPTYVFLNQDVWIFPPPPPPGHVFHKEERDKGGSSWYSWGCPATWVEALHQAVVRPLMADVEGRCDRAAVRILAAWVEDLLVWTKVQVDNWTSGQKIS